MYNIIPGVSQLKSAFQVVCGDVEGARRTQEEFSMGCPIVSQCRSFDEAAMGDTDAARKTQKVQADVLQKAVETTPVVGHMAAAVHYAKGDKEKAKKAFNHANKTTAVLCTAVPLAIVCPPAAAPAAYGVSMAYDAGHSIASGQKQGAIAAYDRVIKGKSNPGEVCDLLFGLGGMAAGVAVAETAAVAPAAAATGADAAAAAAAAVEGAVSAAASAAPDDAYDAQELAALAGTTVAKKVCTSVSFPPGIKQGYSHMKGQ